MALCCAALTAVTNTAPSSARARIPRALVRLSSRAQTELWGLRLTRLYAAGIGFSYSALVFMAPLQEGAVPGLWVKCVGMASWVAGLGALSLARDLAERDTAQGLTGLARLRGYGDAELERARAIAGALKLGLTVALPGAMVALTATLRHRDLSGALITLSLLLFSVLYAAVFGTSMALLARACSRVFQARGRLLFSAIVLGPWLFASGIDAKLPSIPWALGWLLARLGGTAS